MYPSYLMHYGVKGQKWGERQYQFLDGTYTQLGKERRRIGPHDYGSAKVDESVKSSRNEKIKEIKKDANEVNGGAKGFKMGLNRNVNCAFCAMSYELRRRGLDVRAQESLRGVFTGLSDKNGAYGKVIPNFSKVSKNAKTFATRRSDQSSKLAMIGITKKEYKELTSSLLSEGNDSRGFISVKYNGNLGGHIFNYEVIDGELYFVDGQVGKIVKANKYYDKFFKNTQNIQTLRTDNIKINTDKAKKYYSEDNIGKISINKAKESQKVAEVIGGILGLPLMTPFTGAAIGSAIFAKKVKEIDDEASIDLQKKWEEEGRFKDKWYDFEEDKEKKK